MQALRLGRAGLRIVCTVQEREPYAAAAAQAGADAVISKQELAADLDPLLRSFYPERFGAVGVHNE